MKVFIFSKSGLMLIHVLLLSLTIVGIVFCGITGAYVWILPFLTIPMLNVILIPYSYLSIRNNLFNPFLLIGAYLLVGTVLRTFFIVSPLESPTKHLMLMGNDSVILVTGIIHIYLGLIFLVVGFLYHGSLINLNFRNATIFHSVLNRNKLIRFSIIIFIISLISSFLYLQKMGVNLFTLLISDEISAKRYMEVEGGGFTSLGYYRLIMGFSQLNYFLLLVYLLKNKSRDILVLFLLILTGSASIFFYFINSNRGEAGMMIILTFVVIYFIQGSISKKILIPGISIFLTLLVFMTFLRREVNNLQNVEKENPLLIVVGSLNFLGVGKASYIAESIPDKLDFQYGQTLILWIVAPIPRTIWPDKPEISIGKVIAEKIYEKTNENSKAGGVPPGIITELYMNFGFLGIIIGMYFLGVLLKIFYNILYFHIFVYKSAYAVLIYVLVFWGFLGIVGTDLSRSIVGLLSSLVPLYLFVKLVKV